MKKVLAMLLAVLMLASLAACGSKPETAPAQTDTEAIAQTDTEVIASLKTIGDLQALEGLETNQSSADEKYYVEAFSLNGTFYRVVAEMPEGLFDTIMNLEYDDSYDAKYAELVSPLVITRWENLSELIPAQEELDKLVGKTGEELFTDGWNISSGYNLDTAEFYMANGLFEYVVAFDATFPPNSNTDDFDEVAAIAPLTVKSVTFYGLGNATEVE